MERLQEQIGRDFSSGEKTLLEQVYIQCQTHKRQVQYIHMNLQKSEKKNILKCNSCIIQEGISLNETIVISELFESESNSQLYDWPIFGFSKKQEKLNNKIQDYNVQEIDLLFWNFKDRINEFISNIHKQMIQSFEKIIQNGQIINEYFNTISQKGQLQEILLNFQHDKQNSVEMLRNIIKNNDRNLHKKNISQIFKNLKYYEESIHITSIINKMEEIESLMTQFSKIAFEKVQNIALIEDYKVVPLRRNLTQYKEQNQNQQSCQKNNPNDTDCDINEDQLIDNYLKYYYEEQNDYGQYLDDYYEEQEYNHYYNYY